MMRVQLETRSQLPRDSITEITRSTGLFKRLFKALIDLKDLTVDVVVADA
jgi:hypothetical protein